MFGIVTGLPPVDLGRGEDRGEYSEAHQSLVGALSLREEDRESQVGPPWGGETFPYGFVGGVVGEDSRLRGSSDTPHMAINDSVTCPLFQDLISSSIVNSDRLGGSM